MQGDHASKLFFFTENQLPTGCDLVEITRLQGSMTTESIKSLVIVNNRQNDQIVKNYFAVHPKRWEMKIVKVIMCIILELLV